MQGSHLYEYAVIRVVPRVEREEFVNVGVVLCCKKQNYLKCMLLLEDSRLLALDPEADTALIREYLQSFDAICKGDTTGSPIARQDPASRFRWLTANRSSMLQTSRPHIGFTTDLGDTLNKLFKQFVA
jgi:hypothetical protein